MVERSGDKKSEVSTCESQAGCVGAGTEQVFWFAEKKLGSILRSQTPLSYPSQNKTAQSDVTAETALKSKLKKHCEFRNKITLNKGQKLNRIIPMGFIGER
jgi:hypothetical protein